MFSQENRPETTTGSTYSRQETTKVTQETTFSLHYRPENGAIVCENGIHRYTRALYGSPTDWRLETSDRPVFAVVKKNHHRNIRFIVNGIPIDSTDYCKASYIDGMRSYQLKDSRLGELRVESVALPDREGAVFRFTGPQKLSVRTIVSMIAHPHLKRNGDIGVDAPDAFEAAQPLDTVVIAGTASVDVVVEGCHVAVMDSVSKSRLFDDAVAYNRQLASRIRWQTPDPYLNTLAGALVFAADGDWDGQTWLHGCIGWRMPLAGWRAGYVGDVLGWGNRSRSHFDAYAQSQVTAVEPVIPHPSQDARMNLARAEKKWGTQMYSNGYICRNPGRNNQMHHYDMNLNYIDELLWHFQYDADTAYMRKMWPVIVSHLAWEKRNYDPDGDHLYDAYCCIWASDALYYNGGAVTHSSAYNYRGNLLAARIAQIIGEDAEPYRREAAAILAAMNQRLWLKDKGVWAEYEDGMGLKRLHDHPAVWSIYTPIDCGACTPEQAFQATQYVDAHIPHLRVAETDYHTISTSDWMPYTWSINNVAAAEVMHTALAYFEAGRPEAGYRLLKANILDQMYGGLSPANFGQVSQYDAARGECYRDFGDCIGIASRTLIQGLFGIVPQALDGKCIIRPGFPRSWENVSISTPYLSYTYRQQGSKAVYEITQNFSQPLQVVLRQNLPNGSYRDIVGSTERHQVIEVETAGIPTDSLMKENVAASAHQTDILDAKNISASTPQASDILSLGLQEPVPGKHFRVQDLSAAFNASVSDIFKNQYLSPRPSVTTLQIPVQGVGEWCHPLYTPEINDSVFRMKIHRGIFRVAGVPFRTPRVGKNIVYTSLWDNYPDSISVPLKGKASKAWLLLAGSTNHMQSHIANGIVVATYADGTTDTLTLTNPDNWCPIEQDYYIDGKAFRAPQPRPYRVCFGTGSVSRDLGTVLQIQGVYGREIPGGAATMLCLRLNPQKRLMRLTLRTLSNDVVIGLMGVTLQE